MPSRQMKKITAETQEQSESENFNDMKRILQFHLQQNNKSSKVRSKTLVTQKFNISIIFF